MNMFYCFLTTGGALIAVSICLMFMEGTNKIIPAITIGAGGCVIAAAMILLRMGYFHDNKNFFDFYDVPDINILVAEELSTDVGMTVIYLSNEDVEKIENKQNINVYMKDEDNIYNCSVVFENNERNYYFKSGDKEIQLHNIS